MVGVIYKGLRRSYEGVPKKLWELIYFISPDGGVCDIRKDSISNKADIPKVANFINSEF